MSIHRVAEKRYQVKVRLRTQADGSRPWKTKTVHGTIDEARRVEREMLGRRDQGQLSKKAGQLALYCDEWFREAARSASPGTRQHWAWLIDEVIVPRLGHHKLHEITPRVVREFYGDLVTAKADGGCGYSGTTAQKVAIRLGVILDQAALDGLIVANPCRPVKRPQVDTPEKRALSADDARALIATFSDTRRGRAVRDVTIFMLGTGARPGEALALHWDDVDLAVGQAWIGSSLEKVDGLPARIKNVKTARGQRMVPLAANVVAMLRRHRREQDEYRLATGRWRDEGFVFPSLDRTRIPGGPWSRQAFHKAWDFDLRDTRFADLTPYVCRHSFATLMRSHIPDEELSRILGHSSSMTLQRTYSHADPVVLSRVREIIAAVL